MQSPPFDMRFELEGWALFWAQLELLPALDKVSIELRRTAAERARAAHELATLSSHPTAAALRKLYRAAGCDPTRYRPASEALMRRVLKGSELPAIHPFVDLNNCLSLELLAPCCAIAEGTVEPPMVFRAGREGESYDSLKGPFDLSAKPVLCDQLGPFDAPITGSQRVKIAPQTRRALLVAYLPRGIVEPERAHERLAALLEAAPVARLAWSATS